MWLKIKQEGQTAGFGPCFHLPGQPILGTGFLSHSHLDDTVDAVAWHRSQRLPGDLPQGLGRHRPSPRGSRPQVQEKGTLFWGGWH